MLLRIIRQMAYLQLLNAPKTCLFWLTSHRHIGQKKIKKTTDNIFSRGQIQKNKGFIWLATDLYMHIMLSISLLFWTK